MVELADVARPAVGEQRLHRRGLEARDALAVALGVALQEVPGQQRDVLPPLAQRRHVDLDRVQAEEKVLAEAPGRDLGAEGWRWSPTGSRTSQRRVREEPTRSNSPVSSTRRSLPCWESGHVADLVEEERAAVGELEAADAVDARVGEGALDVAEELALEDALRDPPGVQGHERPRRAGGGGVERPRDERPCRCRSPR